MKIVYFNYISNTIGPIIRTLELAKGCSDNGVVVSLYFMHKDFSPPEFVYERIKSYQSDTLHIHYNTRHESSLQNISRQPQTSPKKSPGEPKMRLRGLVKQAVFSLFHIPQEIKILKSEKPDAVMARPDHAFSFCFSTKIARVPLVLDTDGPVEELALYWGISSQALVKFDTWRAKTSDAIMVISNVCKDLLQAKMSNRDCFYIVPNGTHKDEFAPQPQASRDALKRQWGLEGCRVIGYSGNQRVWHGLPNLLKASLPLLQKDKSLKVLIIGCGINNELMKQCEVPEDIFNNQIIFTDRLSYWDMASHIDLADIMVMPYDILEIFYFSPMRMFEAMSLGKSIITSNQGQMHDLLDERSSVMFFDPNTPNGLHDALASTVYNDPFISSGMKNREYLIAEHTWRHRGETTKEAIRYAINNYK
jgi:glycosyltransferase involved in cell wall biosynthesis